MTQEQDSEYALHTSGAIFVEIGFDPDLGILCLSAPAVEGRRRSQRLRRLVQSTTDRADQIAPEQLRFGQPTPRRT